MTSCRLRKDSCLVDMCIQTLDEVNDNIWYYYDYARGYTARINKCRETVGKFSDNWNNGTFDKTCSILESSWMQFLRHEKFTTKTARWQDESEILAKFENKISGCCIESNCDNDTLSSGVQSNGILLVAALLTIFVAIFIRGRKSKRIVTETHRPDFDLKKLSSREETVLTV